MRIYISASNNSDKYLVEQYKAYLQRLGHVIDYWMQPGDEDKIEDCDFVLGFPSTVDSAYNSLSSLREYWIGKGQDLEFSNANDSDIPVYIFSEHNSNEGIGFFTEDDYDQSNGDDWSKYARISINPHKARSPFDASFARADKIRSGEALLGLKDKVKFPDVSEFGDAGGMTEEDNAYIDGILKIQPVTFRDIFDASVPDIKTIDRKVVFDESGGNFFEEEML